MVGQARVSSWGNGVGGGVLSEMTNDEGGADCGGKGLCGAREVGSSCQASKYVKVSSSQFVTRG